MFFWFWYAKVQGNQWWRSYGWCAWVSRVLCSLQMRKQGLDAAKIYWEGHLGKQVDGARKLGWECSKLEKCSLRWCEQLPRRKFCQRSYGLWDMCAGSCTLSIWTGCRLVKSHFDVHFVWPHETGSAWIQVPECGLLHVLQGHMVGFSIGYMSSRL